MKNPDLGKAMQRLELAAAHLICIRGHHYGGNIKHDLGMVLEALKRLQDANEDAGYAMKEQA